MRLWKNSRNFVPSGGSLWLAFICLVGIAQLTNASTDSRPNILIFYVDDLGYGDLGCYGHPVIRTPNIDQFAKSAMLFTNFYAGAPTCSPSRASLLTGRSSNRASVYDITQPGSDLKMPESEVTIAEVLKDEGYETYHTGKWHLTKVGEGSPSTQGFDSSDLRLENATLRAIRFSSWLSNRGSGDDVAPFFAYIAPSEVHEPLHLFDFSPNLYHAPYASRYADSLDVAYGGPSVFRKAPIWRKKPIYYGAVEQVDAAFGRILGALDDAGVADNTLVVFASDNGPEWRGGNTWGSPGPFRGAKTFLYEGGIRVPGVIRWPGTPTMGTVCQEPVHVWDLFPTICEIVGAPLPEDRVIDGTSLKSLLEGGTFERETPMYWSNWAAVGGMQVALRKGRWKILGAMRGFGSYASGTVMDYVKAAPLDRFELYDLHDDPGETIDLHLQEPEVFQEMRQELIEFHEEGLAEGQNWDMEAYRGGSTQNTFVLNLGSSALLARFSFDEQGGTEFLDVSQNGTHGTYVREGAGNIAFGYPSIAAGNSVLFSSGAAGDGSLAYAETESPSRFPTLFSFSVGIWLKWNETQEGMSTVHSIRSPSAVGDLELVFNSSDASLRWRFHGNDIVSSSKTITPGRRHHVVISFERASPARASIYLDGDLVGSQEVDLFPTLRFPVFRFGASYDGVGFEGSIDEVQIYHQALDQADVDYLYANPWFELGQTDPPQSYPDADFDVEVQPLFELSAEANPKFFQLSWPAEAGQRYRVLYKENLFDPTWVGVTEIVARNQLGVFVFKKWLNQRDGFYAVQPL